MTRAEELEDEERTLLPIPYRKRHLAEPFVPTIGETHLK